MIVISYDPQQQVIGWNYDWSETYTAKYRGSVHIKDIIEKRPSQSELRRMIGAPARVRADYVMWGDYRTAIMYDDFRSLIRSAIRDYQTSNTQE